MSIDVDILNFSKHADEQFIMIQHSGYYDDLPEHVQEEVTEEWVDDNLADGDWITIVDHEVVISGEHHPFHIHWEADEDDSPLGLIESGDLNEYQDLTGQC